MTNLFSFLSSTSYTFEGKKEGEQVVIFLHRHWFALFSKILLLIAGGILPFVIFGIFGKAIQSVHMIGLYAALWSAFYMILWYSLFYTLTMYTLDTWIVTNMRIINSKQQGFFNRNISELALDRIQDVSLSIDGAIATMFNYGNIKVQTAGAEKHFLFEQIANPQAVKDRIMELVATRKHVTEHEIGQELKEGFLGIDNV